MPLTSSSPARLLIQAAPSSLPGMGYSLQTSIPGSCTGSITINKVKTWFQCTNCAFSNPYRKLEWLLVLDTKDVAQVAIPEIAMYPWHNYTRIASDTEVYTCQLCLPEEKFCFEYWGSSGLSSHLRAKHTQLELQQVLGHDNVRRCTCNLGLMHHWYAKNHESLCPIRLRVLELYRLYSHSPTC